MPNIFWQIAENLQRYLKYDYNCEKYFISQKLFFFYNFFTHTGIFSLLHFKLHLNVSQHKGWNKKYSIVRNFSHILETCKIYCNFPVTFDKIFELTLKKNASVCTHLNNFIGCINHNDNMNLKFFIVYV